ncbi:hypothetical protein, partial [Ensifer canadensis]
FWDQLQSDDQAEGIAGTATGSASILTKRERYLAELGCKIVTAAMIGFRSSSQRTGCILLLKICYSAQRQ